MELRARSSSVSYSDDRSILGRGASECNFTDYSLNSKPASKWKEDDIDNFRIKVIDVLGILEKCIATRKFVTVDACYSGSLRDRFPRRIHIESNTIVCFSACSRFQKATELASLEGGIFTSLLVEGLSEIVKANRLVAASTL